MDPDSQRLLPFEGEKDGQLSDVATEDSDILHHKSKPQVLRWTTKFILIQVALVVLYTTVSVVLASLHVKNALSAHTPFHGLSISYVPIIFHNMTNNPYAGRPNPDIDAAWDKMMAPMHIPITADELARDNQKSVALPEAGGYLGWLGAFHELHCIDMLRRWIYRDYYHPNVTGAEEEHMFSHVDHCFEMLRQSAVCHADLSLTTFTWHPEKARPMFNASESVHRCMDWSRLTDSFSERVVAVDEIERLKNPLMT